MKLFNASFGISFEGSPFYLSKVSWADLNEGDHDVMTGRPTSTNVYMDTMSYWAAKAIDYF